MDQKFTKKVNHTLIVYRSNSKKTKETLDKITSFLTSKKITFATFSQKEIQTKKYKKGDLILSLGGDGTYLKSTHFGSPTPVLGINMGSLGFLTPHEEERSIPLLEKTLNGKMFLKKNHFLETNIYEILNKKKNNEEILNSPKKSLSLKLKETYHSINDTVIERGSLSHLISLSIYINNQYIYSLKSDGLIVSSSLGSTAYNLAAGGPILHPKTQSLVITPICSHSLTNRPIVINDQSEILLQLHKNKAFLTIDGEIKTKLHSNHLLSIKKNKNFFFSLMEKQETEFSLLRKKLQFGQRN